MCDDELQILSAKKFCDENIRAAEQGGIESLSSIVPGSRLYKAMHNRVDRGFDEAW